jgi:hypothetical protein
MTATQSSFTRAWDTVKESEPTIGEGLDWVNMSSLVDKPILFLQVQNRTRKDADRGEYEEYVFTFREDDAELTPTNRCSSSHTVVYGQIAERDITPFAPFVAVVRKGKGKNGKSGYYFLEPFNPAA